MRTPQPLSSHIAASSTFKSTSSAPPAVSPLHLSYRTVTATENSAAVVLDAAEDVLGAALHAVQAQVPGYEGTLCPLVMMPTLPDTHDLLEVWHAPGPFCTGNVDGVHFRCNDELLFAAIVLEENVDERGEDILSAARRGYVALFETLAAKGFPHLVRCWNYIPRINAEQIA
ncbi:MAG TPA: hypothetical protein VFW00_05465, partial [Rhodocyclaceae bacterium]|nr:hypothetical protein [Rhodocyclaceae bacterium]